MRENDQFVDREYRILMKSFVKGYVDINQKLLKRKEIDCDSSGCGCTGLLIDNNIESRNG